MTRSKGLRDRLSIVFRLQTVRFVLSDLRVSEACDEWVTVSDRHDQRRGPARQTMRMRGCRCDLLFMVKCECWFA